MPILIIWVEGSDSEEQGEKLARKLLESGVVKSAIPIQFLNNTTMLQFPEIASEAIKKVIDQSKIWATLMNYKVVESQGDWKKFSLGGSVTDKAYHLTIFAERV